MKMKKIVIHNFRSILDGSFNLSDYTILVGSNNAGKSNIIDAIRMFYEQIKYSKNDDFPKIPVDLDEESWIEVTFNLSDEEFSSLRDEYKQEGNNLTVRKYLLSSSRVKPSQSNLYGYENGKLSDNLFYGAKNFSISKLGNLIYIPEIAKTDEIIKLTGPSPFRDLITFVAKKVVTESASYKVLNEAFEKFNDTFSQETAGEYSLAQLKTNINKSLKEWDIKFDFEINPITIEEIIKNLISHSITDNNLNKNINTYNLGQGCQRHIIYTLLTLASQYKNTRKLTKKDFNPDYTLILFEEPEAFLHPQQQVILYRNLVKISKSETTQIVITSHSPIFVSKHIEDISNIVRLSKNNGSTMLHQINHSTLNNIFLENTELNDFLKALSDRQPSMKKPALNIINHKDEDVILDEETLQYMMWLNSERCSAFFADHVIICEGPTEKIFIEYLLSNEWSQLLEKGLCIFDAAGKFNIHRYMNVFRELGIKHSVLYDGDKDIEIHSHINSFINSKANSLTISIKHFEKDIEHFLEIAVEKRRDKKPLNVMRHYKLGTINDSVMEKFKELFISLITPTASLSPVQGAGRVS